MEHSEKLNICWFDEDTIKNIFIIINYIDYYVLVGKSASILICWYIYFQLYLNNVFPIPNASFKSDLLQLNVFPIPNASFKSDLLQL